MAKQKEFTTVYIHNHIGHSGTMAKPLVEYLNNNISKLIHIRISSPGGDVFEGITIAKAIKKHKAETITYIDGLAAGISSIIALASDKVLMREDALMMICEPLFYEWQKGTLKSDKVTDTLVDIYRTSFNKSEVEIRKMMAAETWFTAEESLGMGFIDSIYEKEKK